MIAVNAGLISILVGVFLAWSGLLLAAIKILIERAMRGNERRFEKLESEIEIEAGKRETLDREVRHLMTGLPDRYVQREDWIRLSTTIEAKLDRVNEKIENVKDLIHERS